MIVGLAPGLQGAARTGKGFVGDDSGKFLFAALAATGLASSADPFEARLSNCRITNIVKCLPPGNAPIGLEKANCQTYLADDVEALFPGGRIDSPIRKPRVVVALGGEAYRYTAKLLGTSASGFAHGVERKVRDRLFLLASFHPSRLNVNTGRISQAMLRAVFERAQILACQE